MKNIFVLAAFLFCLHLGAQQTPLIGVWKASPKGNTVYLTFGKDSTFKLKYATDSLGGKSFTFGEGEATSKFTVDTTFKPMYIDMMVIQTANGAVINTMQGVFEVIGPDKIRLRMALPGAERPKGFLPKGNEETLVFVRQ